MRKVLVVAFAIAVCAVALPSLAQKGPLGLSPTQGAGAYRQAVGERFSFVCDGSTASVNVYGTDVYTDDSAVCAAAIHAGVLKRGQAGVVTIVIGSGAESFRGSARNGITTSNYRAWPHSYTFARDGAPGSITWQTVWNGVPEDFTAQIVLRCPPNGGLNAGVVWGTSVYTRDSSICLAAVHAGAITLEQGGVIEVERARHSGEFPASLRNGVSSQRWGSYGDSFAVKAAGAIAITAAPAAGGSCALAAAITQAFDELAANVTRQYDALLRQAAGNTVQVASLTAQRDRLLGELAELKRQNLATACTAPPSLTQNTGAGSAPATTPLRTVPTDATQAPVATPSPTMTAAIAPGLLAGAANTTSTAAAPATPPPPPLQQQAAPPPASGYYVVTVNEIYSLSATRDNQLSLDGRGDEIFAAAYRRYYNRVTKSGGYPVGAAIKTRVYGDAAGSTRIQAGTQSAAGGLRAGDTIPDGGSIKRGAILPRLAPGQPDRIPWEIWRGTLREGMDAAAISLSIWESDGKEQTYNSWVAQQAQLTASLWTHNDVLLRMAQRPTGFAPLTPLVIGSTISQNGVNAIVDRATLALAAVASGGILIPSNELQDILTGGADRPIGVRRYDSSVGSDIIVPNTLLVLTHELVEAALRGMLPIVNSGFGNLTVPGPGYLIVNFRDGESQYGPGSYSMILHVERTTAPAGGSGSAQSEADEKIQEFLREQSEQDRF